MEWDYKMNISLADLIEKLLFTNMKIWNLESEIRECKDEELGLEEIGRRALMIRDLNRERISLKNEINRLHDNENYFKEVKVRHVSA